MTTITPSPGDDLRRVLLYQRTLRLDVPTGVLWSNTDQKGAIADVIAEQGNGEVLYFHRREPNGEIVGVVRQIDTGELLFCVHERGSGEVKLLGRLPAEDQLVDILASDRSLLVDQEAVDDQSLSVRLPAELKPLVQLGVHVVAGALPFTLILLSVTGLTLLTRALEKAQWAPEFVIRAMSVLEYAIWLADIFCFASLLTVEVLTLLALVWKRLVGVYGSLGKRHE